MKCANCVCLGYNDDGFLCCLADPRWPAPCEYEDDEDEAVIDDSYDPGLEPDWEMLDCSDEPNFPEGELRIGKEYYDNE